MREERTADEALTDDALILALYALAQNEAARETRTDSVGDRLKAMKLVFLANSRMFNEGAKGLNCTFYRWQWGPMSNEVYMAWKRLAGAGLLTEEEEFQVTRKGRDLALAFLNDVLDQEENRYFLAIVEQTAKTWGSKTRADILQAVYQMEVTPVGLPVPVRVVDAPLTLHFTEVLDPSEARIAINVPDAWLETLALLINPNATNSILRAEEQAREGRVTTDDIWSHFESAPAPL